jgi:type VI secretion system secreted protein VgrG
MALFSQEKRHIRIATTLGKDVLLVEGFSGNEGMSRLFSYELSLVSENQAIAFEDIIGTGVTVSLELPWGGRRFINGIVSRFTQTSGGETFGDDTRVSHYRATVVPWLWLLTKSAESRIFQNLSVPDIAEKIFQDHGFPDFQQKLQGSYQKRNYCVQYRETHFNFISRLLEHEGIHYFFEHSNGKHRLILADAPQMNLPCPEQKSASYQIRLPANKDEDYITALDKSQEMRPAQYSLNDFNFQIPGTSLNVDLPGKYSPGPGARAIYDYPGAYQKKSEGEVYARIRMEEEESQITTIAGSGNCRAFASGYRFTLNNYYRQEMNGREFVLTSIDHHATQSVQAGGDFDYGNGFVCIPAEVPFRPPRITPKPMVHGSQTALVVGPAGEEIHVDEFGRVKVQFHWDREGKRDEKSSCWIRVSQAWAGTNWGALFTPRIGQEVIVDFLEGDPDRPIITGRVYNGLNKPPYPLPAEKTKSTLKSNSSPGAGGCNEIRFEDKKGAEQIFIQAEKQQDSRVKQDSLEWVGNERHLIVTRDQFVKVGGDQHLTVLGDRSEKVDGTVSLRIGRDLQQKVGAMHALEAGQEIHLKAGVQVVIEAGMQLTLKVGGSFIDIGPAGVTIKGAMVLINSGGSAGAGAGAFPEAVREPKEADRAESGRSDKPPPSQSITRPQAAAYRSAAESGAPFCDT